MDTTASPKVTVIIPVWNGGDFIGNAIASVLAQTLGDFELIVVDDASTDNTVDVVGAIHDQDARVTVLHQPERMGVSAARNRGLDMARGAFVAVLDADDVWLPQRLAIMVDVLEQHGVDLVADQQTLVEFGTGRTLGLTMRDAWMQGGADIPLSDFVLMDWPGRKDTRNIGLIKAVMRRSTIERAGVRYDETVHLGEDFLFYACLLVSGARMRFVSTPLYAYSVRTHSLSQLTTPTTGQIEVNRLLREWLCAHGRQRADYARVRMILDYREKALWLQYLLWSLQTRHFLLALRTLPRIGIDVCFLWVMDFVRRKLHMVQSDFNPAIIGKIERRMPLCRPP